MHEDWLLIDVRGTGHPEIQRDDERHGSSRAFTDADAVRSTCDEARVGSLPAIRAMASHQNHKAALRRYRMMRA